MRRPLFGLVALLLLTTSCEVKFNWAWNKDQPPAQASGKTVTEDRTVGSFQKVKLEGLGKLTFDPSVPAGVVRVTTDQGLLPKVRTVVEAGQLRLREEGIQGPGSWNLEFRTAAPSDLDDVVLSGLGSIESEAPLVPSGELTLALDGLGQVHLGVKAHALIVRQQGQGELQVQGTADSVEVRADGLGRVDLGSLETKTARVESNGLGEVTVFASQTLRVRANGMGAVHFKGHPAQTDVQTQGLTQVTAAD